MSINVDYNIENDLPHPTDSGFYQDGSAKVILFIKGDINEDITFDFPVTASVKNTSTGSYGNSNYTEISYKCNPNDRDIVETILRQKLELYVREGIIESYKIR